MNAITLRSRVQFVVKSFNYKSVNEARNVYGKAVFKVLKYTLFAITLISFLNESF